MRAVSTAWSRGHLAPVPGAGQHDEAQPWPPAAAEEDHPELDPYTPAGQVSGVLVE